MYVTEEKKRNYPYTVNITDGWGGKVILTDDGVKKVIEELTNYLKEKEEKEVDNL